MTDWFININFCGLNFICGCWNRYGDSRAVFWVCCDRGSVKQQWRISFWCIPSGPWPSAWPAVTCHSQPITAHHHRQSYFLLYQEHSLGSGAVFSDYFKKVKKIKFGICYSTSYMRQTWDQEHFYNLGSGSWLIQWPNLLKVVGQTYKRLRKVRFQKMFLKMHVRWKCIRKF